MKKLKEQIDYGGRRERMDPNLERKLRSGEDIYATNPAMKKGTEDVQRLVSSRFNKVTDALKQVTGIEDLSSNNVKQMLMGEMMVATQRAMSIESRHKEELKSLAKKISFRETGAPEKYYEVEMYLNEQPIDVSNFRYEPEDDEDEEDDDEEKNQIDFPSFDIEDLTDEEQLELEKHKRNLVLAIIQGSAKKAHYAYQKTNAKAELDAINPQLYPLYNKIMAINDFFYFTMEQMIEMMSETGDGVAGKVETETSDEGGEEGEEGDENNGSGKQTIRAWGLIFPILVHEVVKGIERYLAQFSHSKDERLANKVMGQVDLLRNEPSQLRIGPEIVERMRMLLPDEMFESESEEMMPWFKMKLYEIEAREFIKIFADVITDDESKNKRAAKRFEEIYKDAKQAKEEFESDENDDNSDDGDDDGLDDFLGGLGITRS